MNLDEYRRMYEVEADHFWYRGLRQLFLVWVDKIKPRRILDIGCGTGFNLKMLQERGYDAQGIDKSAVALEFCNQRKVKQVQIGDIRELPFAKESFDLIYSFDVLGVLDSVGQQKALAECYRCLMPGGYLILNVAALQWLYSAHDQASHITTRFDLGSLRQLFAQNAWEIVFLSYRMCLLFGPIVIGKLIGKLRLKKANDATNVVGDLEKTNYWINRLFYPLMKLENACLKRFSMPIGSSLFIVARKQK